MVMNAKPVAAAMATSGRLMPRRHPERQPSQQRRTAPVSRNKLSIHTGTSGTTRAELSDFLKTRRARISPATVGLPNRQRRRTPGCVERKSPTSRAWD